MSVTRDNVKIVLIQLRPVEATRELDFASFARSMRLAPERIFAVDVHVEAPTESLLDGAHALVVGGARYSVWDDVPHLEELIALVRAAASRKIPMLGVCFGAQLFAHMYGGRVVRDVECGEWGTIEIATTDDALDDAVFTDLPFTFSSQQAHQDRIAELPSGATLLATSDLCHVQAFRLSSANVYGLQFHPERSKADYLRSLAIDETPENAAKQELIRTTLRETPEAESVMAKFIDRIVLQH